MTRDMLDDDNWIMGPPSSHPPTSPLTQSSPASHFNFSPQLQPVSHLTGSTEQLAHRHTSGSPALPETSGRNRPSSAGSSNLGKEYRVNIVHQSVHYALIILEWSCLLTYYIRHVLGQESYFIPRWLRLPLEVPSIISVILSCSLPRSPVSAAAAAPTLGPEPR